MPAANVNDDTHGTGYPNQTHQNDFMSWFLEPFTAWITPFDSSDIFTMAPLPVYASGRYVGEPPYASLLRRLGLFDAIEPPAVESRLRMGQFPVVLRNSNGPGGFPPLGRISDDLARDSSRIIESLGDAVGETTRWAVGGLFGHLRDAMDHIESRVLHEASISRGRDYRQSSSQKQAQSTTEIDAGFDRLPSEESDNGRDSYRFYQVTTRTMPDGSIETRKVVRGDGGLEETTVTRHFPESERDDEVTFITDSLSSQQLPGDNNEN